jgi:ATP-binding cassette subfamily F protein 2
LTWPYSWEFIASCGTYANMMKQANSKQKILDKMEVNGLAISPKAVGPARYCPPGHRLAFSTLPS